MNLSASLQHAAFQMLKGTALILYLVTQRQKKIYFGRSRNCSKNKIFSHGTRTPIRCARVIGRTQSPCHG
jgi:hypothetical protein